jgi:hypothetical protein
MFRMFRISPSGHVEKGAVCSRRFQISLQIPSATRACLCSSRRNYALFCAGKLARRFAGGIIKMYLALLTDWQDRGDETIPEYGSRHAFGDGIDPPKAQTDR